MEETQDPFPENHSHDPRVAVNRDSRTGSHLPSPPKTNALSLDLVKDLSTRVVEGEDSPLLIEWAETTLRFCEVTLPRFKSVLQKRSDTPHALGLQIAAFLAEWFLRAQDLRYLNCLLKMEENSWLLSSGKRQREQDDFLVSRIRHALKEGRGSIAEGAHVRR